MTEVIPSTERTRRWGRTHAFAVAAGLALVAATTTTLATAQPARASTWGFGEVWGRGTSGQLGNGSTADQHSPVLITSLTKITQFSGGFQHTLALRDDGTAWGWGDNTYGELGNGTTTGSSAPVQVTGLTDVAQVSAAADFSLALRSDGTVWAWGSGVSGQIGDGGTTNRTTPVQVSGLTGVRQIAAAGSHALALLADGTIRAWGDNTYGELGDGTTTNRSLPVVVSGQSGVAQVAGGYNHSLALHTDGTVRAWGYNGDGELGDGTTINRYFPVTVNGVNPSVDPSLSGVVQLSGGAYHDLAVRTDGTVVAWGGNYEGQIGDGTLTNRTIPVVVGGASSDVARVSAGGYHSLALRTDGTVRAWGYNHYGQVGDGTTTDRTSPVTVPGLSGVFQISGGGHHTLALDR
ncbi:hypothetical protein GCM10027176_68680 [Actinoallomurus bryophytorum]|uniref:Alpha-tubulin suppressor-like RCC1 family protein n=1 Tax=Actinoallomurus bryophytorum TaxID=1490222 RepID=A0A543CTX6_9ACTN|nr:hypothetical protein [Actinoallomurus bryophytorum]TQM00562.1 alpha-tubulin suppressor-like RCC1 family protein [Actinoallomurus bryophytorum]